jgi:nitrite reductase/ring-hydroxylating ferredoxin subunit
MTPNRRCVIAAGLACAAALPTACAGAAPAPAVTPGVGASATHVAGDAVLGLTAEVPPGAAKVFAGQRVVVTQPVTGTFTGLSAVCTHQGCVVGTVDGSIVCPCHGSRYRLDGSVESGPAPRPLDSVAIAVQGNQIVLA